MRRHPALRKSSHRARRFAPKGILVEGSVIVRLDWVEGRSREDDADELRKETSEHDERRLAPAMGLDVLVLDYPHVVHVGTGEHSPDG
ncbi:MAG: hypothetical protein JWQ32_3560 [Marmoricola sp.]|jgi:hypothetical protein|nr:hypothetical protein [Marmoricola sp.]